MTGRPTARCGYSGARSASVCLECRRTSLQHVPSAAISFLLLLPVAGPGTRRALSLPIRASPLSPGLQAGQTLQASQSRSLAHYHSRGACSTARFLVFEGSVYTNSNALVAGAGTSTLLSLCRAPVALRRHSLALQWMQCCAHRILQGSAVLDESWALQRGHWRTFLRPELHHQDVTSTTACLWYSIAVGQPLRSSGQVMLTEVSASSGKAQVPPGTVPHTLAFLAGAILASA
jgi:hypothetical protein